MNFNPFTNIQVGHDPNIDSQAIGVNDCYSLWPAASYGMASYGISPAVTYPTMTTAPRECAGDGHVFPCPHCDTCKCGQAIKAKAKRSRR